MYFQGNSTGAFEDDCATLPTNIIAGLVGFFDKEHGLDLPSPWNSTESRSHLANSSILIIGGGSNCGRFATQLANLAGLGTIVVVGGKKEELRRYGATHVVDRHGGDDAVLQRVRDIVGDDLVYAFDAVNLPAGQHLAINALSNSKQGTLARLVWSRGAVEESKLHPKQAGYVLKDTLGSSHYKPEIAIPFWKHIAGYLVENKIQPLAHVVEQGLDAAKVNEVLDRYRDGKAVTQTHFHL
ncbi:NAD(P)-binding protein [Karstenula rhodostoma CBS 690.94]|uniref:NAD(P)-binding protein n=1 Tax=Karstenula rhodostoma CBS 690.94 TaxID=1392251 RepID=A0A9P4U7F7_9PLEO|nr:NAD(P)-binding protein [Karstenula rhodostoma CBS 690.94]